MCMTCKEDRLNSSNLALGEGLTRIPTWHLLCLCGSTWSSSEPLALGIVYVLAFDLTVSFVLIGALLLRARQLLDKKVYPHLTCQQTMTKTLESRRHIPMLVWVRGFCSRVVHKDQVLRPKLCLYSHVLNAGGIHHSFSTPWCHAHPFALKILQQALL